jgi:outer membrane autotransporter protein
MYLAAALAAGVALAAAPAIAQDATWQTIPTVPGPAFPPGAFDFNAPANWTPATVPTGTASFGATTGPSISFSALNTTINTLQFNGGAPAYTLTLVEQCPGSCSVQTLNVIGPGVINNSSNTPTFVLTLFGTLNFQNSSTAGKSNIVMTDGILNFQNSSNAGNAVITMPDDMHPGHLTFSNTSSAGNANITNNSVTGLGLPLLFLDASTAGNATIVNNFNTALGQGSELVFGDPTFTGVHTSNAGTAHITNNDGSTTSFLSQTSAASATIVNVGGGVNFQENSTAANATITSDANGSIFFGDQATAANSMIVNQGYMQFGFGFGFGDTATAGNATITNNGIFATMGFFDFTTAGAANITNQNGAQIGFFQNSTAGSATINNVGAGCGCFPSLVFFAEDSNAGTAKITNSSFAATVFTDNASAANATIVNNANGFTQFGTFQDAPTAGNATITNNEGGATAFFSLSTAANAIITTNNGGAVGFFDNSNGGNAQFITNAGGIVDFSRTSGPAGDGKITAGSIAGGGDYYLGGNQLTVGSNNLSTEVSGVIHDGASPLSCECEPAGTGGSLVKVGTGKLILSGVNTYTGPTTVDGGALIVNGSIASSSGVTVNAGGTVGGNGTLPKTTINGGTLSPGNSIGTVTISGSLTFVGPGNYIVEVSPAAADKTNVNGAPGTAALAGTLSAVGLGGAYVPGTKYTVLNATGGVSGTFSSLAISGNFGFTKPHVEYDANNVYLVLDPTTLPIVGLTPNQKAVAAAVNTAVTNGSQLPPFFALFGLPLTQLPAALDSLSGEVHVSTLGMLLDESLYPRLAVLGRLRQAAYGGAAGMAPLSFGGPQAFTAGEEQLAALAYAKSPIVAKAPPLGAPPANYDVTFWAQGFGAWGRFDTDANAAAVERKLAGFFSGADTAIGSSGRAGLMAGYTGSTYALDRRGNANVETGHLAGYGGWNFGSINVRGGAAGAWHTIDTSRTAAFTGFFDSLTAHYQGRTAQIFGEAGYGLAFGKVAVEPFAGAAWVQVRTDAVNERGGAAALGFGGGAFEVGYSTLGLRAAGMIPLANDMMLVPRVTAAWQHAFDDVTPTARLAFLGAPVPFTIAGVPLARDSLLGEAGLDLVIGRHATLGISYTGQSAGNVQDHAAKGKFTWKF